MIDLFNIKKKVTGGIREYATMIAEKHSLDINQVKINLTCINGQVGVHIYNGGKYIESIEIDELIRYFNR
ncbi:MAG: hypothetical protein H6585_09965 [Flavobacteriales bacterium]|nr:hypothetical protein [Flavobacteriales bacterium]